MNKKTALSIIDNSKNNLVFINRGEISEISPEYEPLVTELSFTTDDDFSPTGGGKYYPKKETQNTIAKACGISFTSNCGTRQIGDYNSVEIYKEGDIYLVRGNFAVIGWAQGTRIKPDGNLMTSSMREYEFNVIDRANEDILNSQKNKGKKDRQGKSMDWLVIDDLPAVRKKLLDLKKFATQRASTGAQLGVIRELTNIPTGFTKEETTRTMTFHQIIQNPNFKRDLLNEISKTSEGRRDITNALLGNQQKVFGPTNNIPVETVARETVQENNVEEPPLMEVEKEMPDQELDMMANEIENAKDVIRKYRNSGKLNQTNLETCDKLINNSTAKLDKLNAAIEHCRKYYPGVE